MSNNSTVPVSKNLRQRMIRLAVWALPAGMTVTLWRLIAPGSIGPHAVELPNVLISILFNTAAAWIALATMLPLFKWCGRWIGRLLRWIFSWRTIKRGLLGLAALIAIAALFYVEEDGRGKHAWENYRREWEAKGEHFDFAYFAPPQVPDDQNFALTPIVASSYRQEIDRHEHRIEPPDTNVVNRLEMDILA